MRRQICWTERAEDGGAVEIRVTIHAGEVKWQFLRPEQERWDYETPPSAAQWAELEQRLQNRYQRGQVGLKKELEWARQARGA